MGARPGGTKREELGGSAVLDHSGHSWLVYGREMFLWRRTVSFCGCGSEMGMGRRGRNGNAAGNSRSLHSACPSLLERAVALICVYNDLAGLRWLRKCFKSRGRQAYLGPRSWAEGTGGRARFADQEEADYESNELDDCIAFQGFDALWLRFSLNDLRPVLLLERAK
jgi:hypothetical protein